MDTFARETARHAHQRIADLTHELHRLERQLSRRRQLEHRCHLCGDPARKRSIYCHAHSWAEGR